MRIKLNTAIVGNMLSKGQFAGHYSYAKGDEVDMPDDEAQRYINKGMATAVQSSKKQ